MKMGFVFKFEMWKLERSWILEQYVKDWCDSIDGDEDVIVMLIIFIL